MQEIDSSHPTENGLPSPKNVSCISEARARVCECVYAILSKLWIHLTNRKYTALSFNYYLIFFQALPKFSFISCVFFPIAVLTLSVFFILPFGYISLLNVSFCTFSCFFCRGLSTFLYPESESIAHTIPSQILIRNT